MIIERVLKDKILSQLEQTRKGVIIYGARQVGKTTLAKRVIEDIGLKTLEVNADDTRHWEIFSSRNWDRLKPFLADYKMLFIDEAQRIPEIGINLKIIIDSRPELKVLVTGSSSLDLASRTRESLVGRVWSYTLYPVSVPELSDEFQNSYEAGTKLNEWLLYGFYPEVLTTPGLEAKRKLLEEIVYGFLYKDILDLSGIKYPEKILSLLRLLAYQVGSEVSLAELSQSLAISRSAVEHYIDLLEKSFVIFRLSGLSRNLRKEVSKMDKIFFCDLGIRNLIIGNFQSLAERADRGALWENFLMIERRKLFANSVRSINGYFWRVATGAELDYVEERDGHYFGFEFKYGKGQRRRPFAWHQAYPGSDYKVITPESFLPFVSTV